MLRYCRFGVLAFVNLFVSSAITHAAAPVATRKIELKQVYKPKLTNGTGTLWIPIPAEIKGYQKILDQKIEGNPTSKSIESVGPDKVPILKAEWKNVQEPQLEIRTTVALNNRTSVGANSKEASKYLKSTKHVQTDGVVKETADKITAGKKTSDEKAQAIYEWIIANTERDPKVRGCGLGDVKSTLAVGNLKGKCADLNTLFVGLARAAGVPARETFGLRVADSKLFPSLGKSGEVSKGQHCRAEYYSAEKKAWIPADPADVRKAVLEEKLNINDPKIIQLKETLLTQWEDNWIAFNQGRDFTVSHGQSQIPVNYFMYPLLKTEGHEPDGIDPTEVAYTLTSQEIL